jgi:copper transport protein
MRLIAGLVILLAALCSATGASAHASLVSAAPANGTVLASAPKMVRLQFNETVLPGAIRLIDAEGRARDDVRVSNSGDTVTLALPDNLPRGTALVSYRVISHDGHPVGGVVTFSIGAPSATATPPDADLGLNGLIWLARVGVYLGLMVGIGGVFFMNWIARRSVARAVIIGACLAGLIGAALSLALQGLDLLGLPISRIVTLAPWQAGMGTSLGPSLLIAGIAMVASLIALKGVRPGTARALSMFALIGVGLSLAASGHAATAPPQWLTRSAVFLHGVGVAFWVGALAPLAALAWRPKPSLLPILNRFSQVAVPVVAVLVLTGIGLAVVQLGRAGAFIDTRYGIILSIKLALVVLLLGLAALNRFWLTPALARNGKAMAPLVCSIVLECVLAAGILAVVAGWRFTPPPRSILPETPLAIHIHTDKAMFQVLVSPGVIGNDNFVLQLMDGDGSPLQAKEATLSLSMPERGIEAIEHDAELGSDGYWHVRGVPLLVPGRWHIRIDALVSDFDKITLEDDFDLQAQ